MISCQMVLMQVLNVCWLVNDLALMVVEYSYLVEPMAWMEK